MPRIKLIETLTKGSQRDGRRPGDVARASVQIFIVASVNAFDSFVARRPSNPEFAGMLDDEGRKQTSTAAITIQRPLEQVYAFLRDFGNFPLFMTHLDSVVPLGDGRSRWRLRLFGGRMLEWEVELVEDRPGEVLAWRSVSGAPLDSRGIIRLLPAPGGRGTQVHVDIHYSTPARGWGRLVAKILGVAPGQRSKAELRRLKQLLETGEITRSDASVHRLMHAAQPPGEDFVHDILAGEAA
ncbi:MAG: SRPBCC family protein [Enhygromyxa sp.]